MIPIQLPTLPVMRGILSGLVVLYGLSLASTHTRQGFGIFVLTAGLQLVRELTPLSSHPVFFSLIEGVVLILLLLPMGRYSPDIRRHLLISLVAYLGLGIASGPGSALHQVLVFPGFQLSLLIIMHTRIRTERYQDRLHLSQMNQTLSLMNTTLRSMGTLLDGGKTGAELYGTILSGAVEHVYADAGILFLVEDGQQGILRVEQTRGRPPLLQEITPVGNSEGADYYRAEDLFPASAPYIQEAIQEGVTRWHVLPGQPKGCRVIGLSPLLVDQKVYGIIVLFQFRSSRIPRDHQRSQYNQYISHAGITLETVFSLWKAQELRLHTAEGDYIGQAQKHLLPKALPPAPGAEYEVLSRPARGVHSDYWDVFPGPQGNTAFLVSDIAGKGMLSTLTMTIIRGTANLIGGSERKAGEVVTWLNRAITRRLKLDRFANLVYLNLQPSLGTVECAGTSHQNMMIYRLETGSIETVTSDQPALGIDPGTEYLSTSVPVDSGDIILVYTDGVVESVNPQGIQYTSRNLARLLVEAHHYPVRAIRERIQEDLLRFEEGAGNHDDQTLVVIKVK
ncbi:PP2C family protein-serine/threonine phosphatase [Spirochaeta lutea]|uniref:PPM-type phosphatase domain-containing protein n=1 Tax=Spirochaeta lutea TaxID=1480694 RepID=A0A098QVK8_9SPIO|nr:PP2C family protein-serine/threonine phosphatase [Spirochaeta lutea]KGE71845.1 hypothetical protein DC28_08425 [Spirochaeta lutea]